MKIRDSQAAAARGDAAAAIEHALDARTLQPWAASPYLQLALIAEQADDLGSARTWIYRAIERNKTDWRLWLVASRIETSAGSVERGQRNFAQAKRLNPRSPLFAQAAR